MSEKLPEPSEGAPHAYLRAETDVIEIHELFDDQGTGPVAGFLDRLVCVAGNDVGRSFVVAGSVLVIGRGEVDVQLVGGDVSRKHARIMRTPAGVTIEDLASSNGTFVNGIAVTGPRALDIGDRIQIGSSVLVFTRHDELEQRLQRLQKLEAMTDLAKGIAHDFNNMLCVMMSGLEELARHVDQSAEAHETVETMMQAMTSATQLARRLMRVGRDRPATSEYIAVEALVREAMAIARPLLPRTIAVEIDVRTKTVVHAARQDLVQALVNLAINARDAMPRGGRLAIAASDLSLDRVHAARHQLAQEGTYVELLVGDNGSGMEEATMSRIFEPFFTTKPPGKGSGLGLAMVYSAMRNHGGAIDVESERGRGTTFRLILPAGRP